MTKATLTGGVKPMTITGRMTRERERCIGMSDEERRWRAQWLKDQELSPREPVHVDELTKAIRNPIRRFYTRPLNYIGDKYLVPAMGQEWGTTTRFLIGRGIMLIGFIYATTYYFKYNAHDWTRKGGWRVNTSKVRVLPGEENPTPDRMSPTEYANQGFKSSPI